MLNLEYAPVVSQSLLLYIMLLESRMAVVSSTEPTLQQLVVNKIVGEDRRLLLASKLESIVLPG